MSENQNHGNAEVSFNVANVVKPLMSSFPFDGGSVRIVVVEGKPHVVGKDLCEVLGYADATTAIRSHCRGVQILHPIADSLGRMQETRVLSEGDMLRLITHSTLPAAERFERLVFDEILPCIHRHGCYPAPTGSAVAAQADPMQALLMQNETLRGVIMNSIALRSELNATRVVVAQQAKQLQELREDIPAMVANGQARATLAGPTQGAYSMHKIAKYWHVNAMVPIEVTQCVLRQLPRFRIAPSEIVGDGPRESKGEVIRNANGSVANCQGYKAFQQGHATTMMERFLSECMRDPTTGKVTHADIEGGNRPFKLKIGYAQGEKREKGDRRTRIEEIKQ